MDEHEFRRGGAQRREAGTHRSLPRGAAGNRRQQIAETGGGGAKDALIVGMNDRLYGIDLRVAEKGGQSRADHRFPGDLAILFGHVAAGAIAAPSCDNNGRDLSRHGTRSLTFLASL